MDMVASAVMAGSTRLKLLPDERVLLQSTDGQLTLTTHRVRHDHSEGFGHSRVVGITLDSVASCGLVHVRFPVLLGLALVLAAIGLYLTLSDGSAAAGLFVLMSAGFATLLYFILGRAVLVVASAGERISVAAKGMTADALAEFVDALERAKLQR